MPHRHPSKPIYRLVIAYSVTTISHTNWTNVEANLPNNVSFVSFLDSSGAQITMGLGPGGSPTSANAAIDIPPGAQAGEIYPLPMGVGTKISLIASLQGADVTTGQLIITGYA